MVNNILCALTPGEILVVDGNSKKMDRSLNIVSKKSYLEAVIHLPL